MNKLKNYSDYLIDSLEDENEADNYLRVSLEEYYKDRDIHSFLIALKDIAKARGGITKLARETNLNRENIYRIFSKNGNPRIMTLEKILNNFGLKFSIEMRK